MHPAQLNAINLLLNNLVSQAQAQLQICNSLKQIISQSAPQRAIPQMPGDNGYLNPQEEAVLGAGIMQAQQHAAMLDQQQQMQGQMPGFDSNMHQAFDAAAAGMLPHHPGQRRMAPKSPMQAQRPAQANGVGNIGGFDPMMGLGELMNFGS